MIRMGDTAARALTCLEEIAQQKGLDDVSMRDVARHMGISLAALQHHYPTKADLFDAFVGESLDRYRDRITRIQEQSPSQERFVRVLDFLARETLLVARGGVLAMIEARAFHDEPSLRAMQRFTRSYIEGVADLLAAEFPQLPRDRVLLCATLVCSQLEGLATTHEVACAMGADRSDLIHAAVQVAASIPASFMPSSANGSVSG